MARQAGGSGRPYQGAPVEIGGVRSRVGPSYSVFPPTGAEGFEEPSDSRTPGVHGDLETISIPTGWWKKAETIFREADGTREERVASVMLAEFGEYNDEARARDAFQSLQARVLKRSERWQRAIDREEQKAAEEKEASLVVEIMAEESPEVEEAEVVAEG